MSRLRAVPDWLERILRAILWSLEQRLAIAAFALLAAIVVVAILWWQSSDEVRNFGLLAGGVVAGALAIWRSRVAERQADTAEAARLDARFELGLRMLQDEREAVPIDGLRILQRLADEYPDSYGVQIAEMFDRRSEGTSEGDFDGHQ